MTSNPITAESLDEFELSDSSFDEHNQKRHLSVSYDVITLRTHEITIERQTGWYLFFSILNRILLVLATLMLLGVMALSIMYSMVILDNMHVIEVIRTQTVPGSTP